MTLPNDVARCTGTTSPVCSDCLRRTAPPTDHPRQPWVLPKQVVLFECELKISPTP